jgi:hypothetical protein
LYSKAFSLTDFCCCKFFISKKLPLISQIPKIINIMIIQNIFNFSAINHQSIDPAIIDVIKNMFAIQFIFVSQMLVSSI